MSCADIQSASRILSMVTGERVEMQRGSPQRDCAFHVLQSSMVNGPPEMTGLSWVGPMASLFTEAPQANFTSRST